jgi:hypothetical protein
MAHEIAVNKITVDSKMKADRMGVDKTDMDYLTKSCQKLF